MTSFPLSNMKKTGNKVYVRRHRPPSSSSISSITDFSSSVPDGKRATEEIKQAGLATEINICSVGGFPPKTDFASWGLDPDAEKKSRKKKKKRRKNENRRGSRSPGGASPAGNAGVLTATNTLSPFTPSGPASDAPGAGAFSMEPPSLPSSAYQSGLHGLPINEKSSDMDNETPLLHAVLIGILVLSLLGLLVLAYLMATKSPAPDRPIEATT